MDRKIRFLVSLHTRENDFQVAQARSAEDAARKLESELEIIYAGDDAVHQSTELLKAIQSPAGSRPDAIVGEPGGWTALPQVAGAASAAGIGWAGLNRRPGYLTELRRGGAPPAFSLRFDH